MNTTIATDFADAKSAILLMFVSNSLSLFAKYTRAVCEISKIDIFFGRKVIRCVLIIFS